MFNNLKGREDKFLNLALGMQNLCTHIICASKGILMKTFLELQEDHVVKTYT